MSMHSTQQQEQQQQDQYALDDQVNDLMNEIRNKYRYYSPNIHREGYQARDEIIQNTLNKFNFDVTITLTFTEIYKALEKIEHIIENSINNFNIKSLNYLLTDVVYIYNTILHYEKMKIFFRDDIDEARNNGCDIFTDNFERVKELVREYDKYIYILSKIVGIDKYITDTIEYLEKIKPIHNWCIKHHKKIEIKKINIYIKQYIQSKNMGEHHLSDIIMSYVGEDIRVISDKLFKYGYPAPHYPQ